MKHRSFMILLVLALTVILMPSCKRHAPRIVNPAFKQYIQAYTAGVVSTHATIKIRLNSDFVDSVMFNAPVEEKLFDFSPNVKGKAFWIDSRTIEFRPDEPLPPKEFYDAEFYITKLLKVPDSLKTFEFQFQTLQQDFEVDVTNHKAYKNTDLTREKLYGTVYTADVADDKKVEKILKATQDGKALPITWTKAEKKQGYTFQVDSVIHGHEKSYIKLEWSGTEIGADTKGELNVEIPPLGEFKFLEAEVVQFDEQYIVARFSDPLKEDQNLAGLIRLGKNMDLRYSIEDNELKIYPPEIPSGQLTLTIEPSLKNSQGKLLGKIISQKISFEDTRPNLRFAGSGVVMPSSNGLLLPFEAVNLKAVDIKVIRIYENNMLQFLQVNEMDGQSELARVGKIVLKKTIPLTHVVDYGKWNRFSIDLSTLIKAEPGAVYSVSLNFKKAYSTYPCNDNGTATAETGLTTWGDLVQEDETDWSYHGSFEDDYYDYDGYYDYDWKERNNPCDKSYYNGKSVSRNVLASDLGLIAKAGADGNLTLFATDILTAKPLSGVQLEAFDYQQQLLASGKTDDEGKVVLSLKRRPFVVLAHKDKQVGYLKLAEGTSLSLSMFDVGGEILQHGLKGLIYGDRGVWRPGDSLFMIFILEDKAQKLPQNHPVTFSLYNPAGQVVTRITKTSSVNGFYNFSTATDASAPTGNWLAKVKVGGNEFQKTVKIETVKPNRLKISLGFGADRLIKGKPMKASLSAKWLTGATARKLKATVALSLTKSGTKFKNYPDYIFDNPASGFSTESLTVFNGSLNDNGVAEFQPDIRMTGSAPGILNANFETNVFEEGGDFSVDRFTLPYYPFLSYAGIKVPYEKGSDRLLYTGRNYNFSFVNVDADGNSLSRNRLKVEVYKLEWRWWWDNSESSASADFISTSYNHLADSMTVSVTNGKAEFPFQVTEDDWGRYFIRVTDRLSGHVTGAIVYFDWYGYNRAPGGEKQAAAMLSFSADKPKYKVGEEVKLTIPSSEGGRVLVSVENGTTILKTFWVPATKGTTECKFDVTGEMAPNCYASVTLIQPHAQTLNDLPIRLYGVIPIPVEDPETHLFPVISMSNVLAPDQTASITVREEKGKAMTYTLAIVDEGLLDLTRFKTPDPWSVFYAKEALGIKTWDIFDLVMGAFSGELQRILSIGGDQDKINKGNLKANRFKPMVKFLGPFELKKGEARTHTFKMPNYVGSVRVMVVAGNNGAYGTAEKTVPVKKPLMVLGTLPRVVGPGETVKLPVTVFAMEKTVKNVSVSVSADQMFTISGPVTQKLSFSRPGDDVVMFELKVKEMIGVGKIHILATSGNEKAMNDIEIDVRIPNPEVTNVMETILEPGQTWNVSYQMVGITGTNKGKIEVSSVPPLNLEKRLSYLIEYPYGCIEQTTSSVFPQLYLADLADISPTRKSEIERNIRAGISRLKSFQITGGGLTYWPGGSYADDWGTCYAGHFLLEAEQKGYTLPVGFMQAWKNFQKQKAISWLYNASYSNDELIQAYRLYTLALARVPELGAMNKLLERKNLSLQARWRLAAAYQLAGKPEEARKLVATATTVVSPYREQAWSYGSGTRDEAMIVEALCLLNMKPKAADLVRKISADMSREEWMSTQTTAYCLIAISKFTGAATGKGIHASYTMSGGAMTKMETDKAIATADMNLKKSFTGGGLRMINEGKNVLYARIVMQGIPVIGDITAAQNDLKMSVVYLSTDGRFVDPALLPQGTNFIAEVTVSNPGMRGTYRQLALSQIFPSGWEIINARMSEVAQANTQASPYTYQDIRDDRVYTYFDLEPGRMKTFRIMLNSTYMGRFYLPSVYCSAMYDNTINARIPGKWVVINPSGKQ
ncbi:MAG: MG2 domain-containing protein [Bacteroidetes bacterium]|nr:MG2 domain-containing protein [Bacteroidota bacterium]